jgi:hypothetical protein
MHDDLVSWFARGAIGCAGNDRVTYCLKLHVIREYAEVFRIGRFAWHMSAASRSHAERCADHLDV